MTKTYKDLLNKLNNMNEDQLNSDITILNDDNEYHKATLLFTDEQTCDVLDHGHPVITWSDHKTKWRRVRSGGQYRWIK